MIIRLIPEGNENSNEIEIRGVKEFMLFGNNISDEGKLVDFHEWTGSFKYLLGSMSYYHEVINDERRDANSRSSYVPQRVQPQLRVIEREDEE